MAYYGEAVDPGQVMSANNAITSSSGGVSGAAIGGAIGGVGNFVLSATLGAKQSALNISSLRRAKEQETTRMKFALREEIASNKESFFGMGLKLGAGTSASQIVAQNQMVGETNIKNMRESYDIQIKNEEMRQKSSIISGALGAVGGILGLAG